MTKAERAIKALREAADAVDDLGFQRIGLLGPLVHIQGLRDEADWIESMMGRFATGKEESIHSEDRVHEDG